MRRSALLATAALTAALLASCSSDDEPEPAPSDTVTATPQSPSDSQSPTTSTSPSKPTGDNTPVDDPATNPLSSGVPNYNFYALEVVQRMGYDSFTPDSGVLISKNKDTLSKTFSFFNIVRKGERGQFN